MTVVVPTDPESEHIKEVYARFGLAMYLAQCLEKELAILLATEYGPGPSKITRAEFEDLLESIFSNTLGRSVKRIQELSELSEDETEQLKKALDMRNWLAHNYFWERAASLMSESGRDSMIEELVEATELFEALDALFTEKSMEWSKAHGMTQEIMEEHLQRLLSTQNT